MNFHGAAKSVGAGFGETEVADLSVSHKLRHGADCVFDWRIGIDAVLVIKIDGFDTEAAEAGLAGLADVFGLATHASGAGVAGIADNAELRRQHHLVALAFDAASD